MAPKFQSFTIITPPFLPPQISLTNNQLTFRAFFHIKDILVSLRLVILTQLNKNCCAHLNFNYSDILNLILSRARGLTELRAHAALNYEAVRESLFQPWRSAP